jgi:hypothetical protein
MLNLRASHITHTYTRLHSEPRRRLILTRPGSCVVPIGIAVLVIILLPGAGVTVVIGILVVAIIHGHGTLICVWWQKDGVRMHSRRYTEVIHSVRIANTQHRTPHTTERTTYTQSVCLCGTG